MSHLFLTPPLAGLRQPNVVRSPYLLEGVTRSSGPEWDAVSACSSVGKPHPIPITNSGSHFPPRLQPETVSHFSAEYRDAFSAEPLNRKLHPIPKANSGTGFPKPCPSGKPVPLRTHPGMEYSLIRPSINKGAPSRAAGTKFIASSARKEGHLIWPSSCAGL